MSSKEEELQNIIRDFKKHTSRELIKAIKDVKESRREWMLNKFAFEAKSGGRTSKYKLWQDGFHPVILDTNKKVQQRVEYIHYNPVAAGFCYGESHYANSSYLVYTDENKDHLSFPIVALY